MFCFLFVYVPNSRHPRWDPHFQVDQRPLARVWRVHCDFPRCRRRATVPCRLSPWDLFFRSFLGNCWLCDKTDKCHSFLIKYIQYPLWQINMYTTRAFLSSRHRTTRKLENFANFIVKKAIESSLVGGGDFFFPSDNISSFITATDIISLLIISGVRNKRVENLPNKPFGLIFFFMIFYSWQVPGWNLTPL